MSALGSARVTISAVARSRRSARPWPADLGGNIDLVARLLDWFRQDTALRRSRLALLDLTDEQLRDVGLTRWDARTEARRSTFL